MAEKAPSDAPPHCAVFKSSSLTGKKLGTLYFGQAVTVVGKIGSTAILRNAKGQTGYCDGGSLNAKDPCQDNKTVYAQRKNTPVYRGCSAKTKKLATLRRDQTVTMTGLTQDGEWVRVRSGRRYGYIQKTDLDDAPYSEGQPAWVCYDGNVGVSSMPQGWGDLGTLSFGQFVRLMNPGKNYAKIRNKKGQIGFCPSEAISRTAPGAATTAYTQVSGKFLYRKPGGSAAALTKRKLSKNTKLTLIAAADYWAKVKYRGKTWYIPRLYLGKSKAPAAGKGVVTTARAELLDKPSASGKLLGKLSKGAKLILTGGSGACAKVKTSDGKYEGWVLVSQLK